jgi:rhodanese-related sulfurtransferase
VIDQALREARAGIARFTPAQAAASDALIVDLRSYDERARTGIIPGSVHVPRSVLEWRCDATSGWSNPEVVGRTLILVCAEGYSSSLAAASLAGLGIDAGDLDGGFDAWRAAGLPTAPAPEQGRGLPGMGGPE